MASTNFVGAGGTQYYDDVHTLDNCWHKGPTMSGTGTLTADRSGGNIISGSVSANSYRPLGSYGYPVYISISSSSGGSISISNLQGGGSINGSRVTTPNGGNWGVSFDFTVDCGSATTITVTYTCGQTPNGCEATTYGLKNNSLWFDDAYTAPSYSFTSVSPSIGIAGETTYTATYSITGGTNNLDWVIVGYGNTSWRISNSKGRDLTTTFTLPNDGSQYNIFMRFSDFQHEYDMGTKTVRTYRTPKIQSVAPSHSTVSGVSLLDPRIKWSTNKRRWEESAEQNFKTQMKFVSGNNTFYSVSDQQTGSDSNNTMYDGSEILSTSLINTKFSSAQRSVSSLTTQVVVRRTNPSSGKYAEGTTNLKIQFQPTYAPSGMSFKENNSQGDIIPPGSTIYVDNVPNIYVTWAYTSEIDSGVVNGYEITTYNASGTLLDTYTYNVPSVEVSTVTSRLGNITISSYDLKRGEVNQIKIRAFYNKPNGSGKLYGPYLSSSFVKPVGRLSTPTISYPKSGTWHSNDFRVLFQLPSDSDYSTYTSSVQGSYAYKDIQVKINNQTYSYSTDPQIFSTDKSGYQKKICVRWMLASGVNLSTTYNIQVRVQKNYYTSDWSNWSSTVTIKVQELDFSVNKGDKILDDHFNTVGTSIRRGYTCYPFGSYTDSKIFEVEPGDYILHDDENTMYQIIKGIQNGINTWAVYDNNNCKLTNTVNAFDNDPTQEGEYITAKAEDTTVPGRNYIQILSDEFNKLKN